MPSSYCGIYGFRPTHGRIPVEGLLGLAPSLDTVGWFARDADLLRACGSILLSDFDARTHTIKLLVAHEAFEMAVEPLKIALRKALKSMLPHFKVVEHFNLGAKVWHTAPQQLRTLQGREAWQLYGDWILENGPDMAQAIVGRFAYARSVTEEDYAFSVKYKAKLSEEFDRLLQDSTVLCLPTTWNLPPLIDSSDQELQDNRAVNMRLTSIASLAGLPQLSIPINYSDSQASGLSFIAGKGQDMLLLNLAQELGNAD